MEIERYIYGKVDKVEHITALIDRMTIADFNELRGIMQHSRSKLLDMRRNMFVDLKKVWADMVKEDKKSGKERKMFIRFNQTDGREFVISVIKFAVKYIYGYEVVCGLRGARYKINNMETMDTYWIE